MLAHPGPERKHINYEESQNIQTESPQLMNARLTDTHTYEQNSIIFIKIRNLHYFLLFNNTLCTACTGIYMVCYVLGIIPILYHKGCVLT
jgi:hypothetical protein